MEDFDEARTARAPGDDERSFKLGGEVFTIRQAVRPEVLVTAVSITNESGMDHDVKALDETMHGLLEEEGRGRYTALRERESDPVTYFDLVDVVRWAMKVHTGRPTERPAPSLPGPGPTGAGLTAVAPLPAAETSTG